MMHFYGNMSITNAISSCIGKHMDKSASWHTSGKLHKMKPSSNDCTLILYHLDLPLQSPSGH